MIRIKELRPDGDDLSVHETSLNEGKSKYIDGFRRAFGTQIRGESSLVALGMGAWWNPTQAKGRLGWGTRELWFVRKANT